MRSFMRRDGRLYGRRDDDDGIPRGVLFRRELCGGSFFGGSEELRFQVRARCDGFGVEGEVVSRWDEIVMGRE